MQIFKKIFRSDQPIIGMIHVQALPGTPECKHSIEEIISLASREASIYKQSGIDALMIENMHDVPYLKNDVGHEISTAMALVAHAVKKESQLPVGIQILAGANKAALAVAKVANLDFVRVEGFVFGHLADEGYIDSQAAEIMRYRKSIGATNIAIFTDIKKKHSSHAITADISISEVAHAAEFFNANGLIVTGKYTGSTASISEIKEVKRSTKLPVIIGSGVTIDNVEEYIKVSDALIVGSYFKQGGFWKNELDKDRIRQFMQLVTSLR
jgi:membrane complex biogenesis BtpA family protein